MSEHIATIRWSRSGPDFLRGKYSREHTWTFDGGVIVPASASPHAVPTPWANPANVDPEEGFVASISSCHMLTLVWLASRAGFSIDSYEDKAVGALSKNERGSWWVSTVTLHPQIVWGGDKPPTPAEIDRLHHEAHLQCFIANSVRTEVKVEPPSPVSG